MYRIIYFLKFYFTATNQHGVHSPFVYDFVTKCLYKSTNAQLNIAEKVLIKSIDYFGFKNLYLEELSNNLKDKLNSQHANLKPNQTPWELYYTNGANNILEIINHHEYKNESMLLITNIHKNKENHHRWLRLKEEKKVQITIDLFYCGIIFFRLEQAKEHFKIRI